MRSGWNARWLQRVLVVLVVASCGLGHAHDSRPLYVEVEQLDGTNYSLAWKTPSSVTVANLPTVVLAAPCRAVELAGSTAARHEQQRLYVCAEGQPPAALSISFPSANPSLSTIVRVQRLSAGPEVIYAPPEAVTVAIVGRRQVSNVAWQYAQLGIRHIVGGFDHLLFVACLVLLAVSVRRIAWAITGFTVAHSITLALAALDLVRLPVVPVEAAIALSIVFLAAELARRQRMTLTRRYPGVVALLFGLLHGFGFATVLQDIGLPAAERFTALFLFNVGVEVGQLVFLTLLVLLLVVTDQVVARERLQRLAAYPIGIVASFWLWQRLVDFW